MSLPLPEINNGQSEAASRSGSDLRHTAFRYSVLGIVLLPLGLLLFSSTSDRLFLTEAATLIFVLGTLLAFLGVIFLGAAYAYYCFSKEDEILELYKRAPSLVWLRGPLWIWIALRAEKKRRGTS